MNRNTVLTGAVALALGIGSGTAQAAGSIGVPAPGSGANPTIFAKEMRVSPTAPVNLFPVGVQTASGTLGFGVSAGQSVFLRFDISGDGATFNRTASSPSVSIACKTTNGSTASATGTPVAGGAGTNYVIFQVTSPTGGCGQTSGFTLKNHGVGITGTNSTATIAYGEYANSPDAANQTNALAAANNTLFTFAQTLFAFGYSGSPLDIDVSTNNTLFVSGDTVSPIGSIVIANLQHRNASGGFLGAVDGLPNPMLVTASSASTLTVKGDFSAGPTTGNGRFAASDVFLDTAYSHCGGASTVSAASVTATEAVFNLGQSTFGGIAPNGTTYQPELVCYHVDGTTPIQFGVTYTASYSPTAKPLFTLPASFPLTLGTLNTNGVTATVLNIPNANAADKPYVRIYNTSSIAGPIRGTLYAEDGTVLYNGVLIPSLAPGAVHVLSVQDLQNLAGKGWTGRAYLQVFGQIPNMDVQALIRDSNGTLVNVSSKAPGG